jgi:hypothetical protein
LEDWNSIRGVTERLPNRKSTPFSLSKHSTPHILIYIVLTKCGEKRWDKIGSLKVLQFFLTVAIYKSYVAEKKAVPAS